VLDAGGGLGWTVAVMKTTIFAAFIGIAIVTAGCISTVSGTHTFAVPFEQDSFSDRYERSVDQVYQASVAVIKNDGVMVTEYIPHDTTNAVRSLQGRVNQRNVWVRVEAVDPRITEITVEARTKYGGRDMDLAHKLGTEIALQLTR
jgi:Protein of unknown function (DUF3568)